MATKKTVPFDFVFEYLAPLPYVVKPFFGCYGVYAGDKIMLILRERADHTEANGVWIATSYEHHESLKKIFPSLQAVTILNDGGVVPDDKEKGCKDWEGAEEEEVDNSA